MVDMFGISLLMGAPLLINQCHSQLGCCLSLLVFPWYQLVDQLIDLLMNQLLQAAY